jgi:hypothetical protein
MKKIAGTLLDGMPPIRLYREDIDEIVARISRTSDGVDIVSGGYAFESLDELREQRGPRIQRLAINGGLGSISLDIGEGSTIWMPVTLPTSASDRGPRH